MTIKNSVKRTIKVTGFATAAFFGLMLIPSTEVSAQTMRAQERREDRQDRREDRRDDRRDAAQEGYRDGLREGAEDARAGRRAWAQGEVSYRRADGHNSQRERQAYRSRFIQGYNEGYRNNRRRGTFRRSY